MGYKPLTHHVLHGPTAPMALTSKKTYQGNKDGWQVTCSYKYHNLVFYVFFLHIEVMCGMVVAITVSAVVNYCLLSCYCCYCCCFCSSYCCYGCSFRFGCRCCCKWFWCCFCMLRTEDTIRGEAFQQENILTLHMCHISAALTQVVGLGF